LKWERPLTTCKLFWLVNGDDPQYVYMGFVSGGCRSLKV
jgi:hypothetical protein